MIPDAPQRRVADAAASLAPHRGANERRPCTVKAGLESVGVGTAMRSVRGVAPGRGRDREDQWPSAFENRDGMAVDALAM
jgi:hypothetical protein